MNLEYLKNQKIKYVDKMEYFDAIGFSNLSGLFRDIVDMISKMEEYIQNNSIQNNNQEEKKIITEEEKK